MARQLKREDTFKVSAWIQKRAATAHVAMQRSEIEDQCLAATGIRVSYHTIKAIADCVGIKILVARAGRRSVASLFPDLVDVAQAMLEHLAEMPNEGGVDESDFRRWESIISKSQAVVDAAIDAKEEEEAEEEPELADSLPGF